MSMSMLGALALRKSIPAGYSKILEAYQSESADVALLDTVTTGNIQSLTDLAVQIDKGNEIVAHGVDTATGLETLIDDTVSLYGDEGITEQGAELLRISVESYMNIRGIPVPASEIVPSFESGMTRAQYSTEVLAAKDNILKRIFAWLYVAMKAIVDGLKSYFVKIDVNTNDLKTYINKVKAKVDGIDGELKNTDAKINLGASAIWLTDRNDALTNPSKQIVDTVARFEDFVVEWGKIWGALTNFQIPAEHKTSAEVNATSEKIKDLALASASAGSKAKINFVVTHELELKNGTGELPLLNSSVKIDAVVVAKEHEAPVLTKDQMQHGIADALSAMAVLGKLNTEVDRLNKLTQRISDLSRNVSIPEGEDFDATKLRDAFKVLSKACTLASWGWTNTTPYFLKTIKACVSYIDSSTGHYGIKG